MHLFHSVLDVRPNTDPIKPYRPCNLSRIRQFSVDLDDPRPISSQRLCRWLR